MRKHQKKYRNKKKDKWRKRMIDEETLIKTFITYIDNAFNKLIMFEQQNFRENETEHERLILLVSDMMRKDIRRFKLKECKKIRRYICDQQSLLDCQ